MDDGSARGPVTWTPGANLQPGDGPRNARWQAFSKSKLGADREPRHEGRLYVVTDGRVASSGETFVQLAMQLPDAVQVGLNTSVCSEYGNLQDMPPLPNTGYHATFGHTRFVWNEVRPVVEGRGIVPDLWLDVDDPVAFVAGLPAPGALE